MMLTVTLPTSCTGQLVSWSHTSCMNSTDLPTASSPSTVIETVRHWSQLS